MKVYHIKNSLNDKKVKRKKKAMKCLFILFYLQMIKIFYENKTQNVRRTFYLIT